LDFQRRAASRANLAKYPTVMPQGLNRPRKAERPPRKAAVLRLAQRKAPYRSLFRQLIRSPSVVVELETGALWLSFL
jgi:hypothetical protein